MKRRYAAHFVYVALGVRHKLHAVEVEEGAVTGLFPLQGEEESTEWLGGIIILSPSKRAFLPPGITFQGLLVELCGDVAPGAPLYACHLQGVDLATLSLLPHATLRVLL